MDFQDYSDGSGQLGLDSATVMTNIPCFRNIVGILGQNEGNWLPVKIGKG